MPASACARARARGTSTGRERTRPRYIITLLSTAQGASPSCMQPLYGVGGLWRQGKRTSNQRRPSAASCPSSLLAACRCALLPLSKLAREKQQPLDHPHLPAPPHYPSLARSRAPNTSTQKRPRRNATWPLLNHPSSPRNTAPQILSSRARPSTIRAFCPAGPSAPAHRGLLRPSAPARSRRLGVRKGVSAAFFRRSRLASVENRERPALHIPANSAARPIDVIPGPRLAGVGDCRAGSRGAPAERSKGAPPSPLPPLPPPLSLTPFRPRSLASPPPTSITRRIQ